MKHAVMYIMTCKVPRFTAIMFQLKNSCSISHLKKRLHEHHHPNDTWDLHCCTLLRQQSKYTHTHICQVSSCHIWSYPLPKPGLGPTHYFRRTLGSVLDKLLDPGQVLPGALSYAFQQWSRNPKSHLSLGRVWHSHWYCPLPAQASHQFTILHTHPYQIKARNWAEFEPSQVKFGSSVLSSFSEKGAFFHKYHCETHHSFNSLVMYRARNWRPLSTATECRMLTEGSANFHNANIDNLVWHSCTVLHIWMNYTEAFESYRHTCTSTLKARSVGKAMGNRWAQYMHTSMLACVVCLCKYSTFQWSE